MKYEEIRKLLQYNDYNGMESKLFMPNELFEDLKNNIKNTPHIAFAYTYIYLVTWLYRHSKHTVIKGGVSNSTIKEILGYNPETRTVNYLITKNGLLDKIGYTSTDRNFPIASEIIDGRLEFVLVNELESKEDPLYSYEYSMEKKIRENVPKNFTIKYPVKAFEREVDEKGFIDVEGTFYEFENTHLIPFEVFMYCMSKEDIGCTGFYLYAYLSHKNDIYGGYDVSLEDLVKETGIADRTLDKYLGMLKGYKMIDFQHNQEYFAIGMRKEDRMANTYTTNDYDEFVEQPVSYQKINIVKKKDYFKMLLEEEEAKKIEIWGDVIDIPLESLPY
ncbi:hypothetical protein [Fictibacillus phosphorivorans]|uniref:hypothetical protein n=1 Tax=Fictibacillus phosphorivorans TaxID=1221500 RepID=UPI0035E9B5AE